MFDGASEVSACTLQFASRLRHPEGKPMRSVTVNGKPHRAFDAAREIVRLKPGRGEIVVRAQY